MASKSRAEGAVEFALPRANAGEHLRRKGQDAGTGNLQKANGRQKVLGGAVVWSDSHGNTIWLWKIYGDLLEKCIGNMVHGLYHLIMTNIAMV